jgi:hypothetical protein
MARFSFSYGERKHMAAATETATLGSNVNKVWRKIQGAIAPGMNFLVEEFEQVDQLTDDEDVPYSAREVTRPIDITEGAGASSIQEGGYLARPSSSNMQEITISILQLDGRFNATGLSQYGDKPEAQLERQLKFQGADKLRTMARTFGDYFYGTSNGYLAQVNAAQTGATLTHTLTNGFGQSSITDPAYLADKFRVGDYIALIRSAALVASSIGNVTGVDTVNGAITVVYPGTVTCASLDFVVKANSMENTTIAGTDYGAGFVGMSDILTATSVHSLSNSGLPRWAPSVADTAAGRYTGSLLHKDDDAIKNYGSSDGAKLVYIAQGVNRDVINLERGGYRVTDSMGMEIDGSIKSKGRTFFSSRRVPPGWVVSSPKNAIKLWSLLPKPNSKYSWSDGKELIDQDIMVFDMRWPVALITHNRAQYAYHFNKTSA